MSTFWIAHQVWDEAPFQEIELPVTYLRITADDKKLLRWRSIPPPGIIRNWAVADIKPVNNPVRKRPFRLNDASHAGQRTPAI